MADFSWSKEQSQAIYEKNSNILVAAAAGSGKTAVLVERIINKVINDNIDIDKLLVVTFTSAAAGEMRDRILEAIYKKLEENPEDAVMQKQLLLINKANICTIDSFCQSIIKNNFFEIESSANFRIADATEIALMQDEILEDIFEKKYTNKNAEFLSLLEKYTDYKSDDKLKEMILRIFTFIQSNPFPEEWLHEAVEKLNLEGKENCDLSEFEWGKIILEEVKNNIKDVIIQCKGLKVTLDKFFMDKYSIAVSVDIDELEEILKQCDNWDNAYEKISSFSFQRAPSSKGLDQNQKDISTKIGEERNRIKDIITKDCKTKLLICDSVTGINNLKQMYKALKTIEEIVVEFRKEFAKKKKEKNVIDFNDMEHFALEILRKKSEETNKAEITKVAEKYQEKFAEVAIDEYQDSNMVQELILTSVAQYNNVFMVGDVKQSIYKFRQACPDLFLDKYSRYKLKEDKKEDDEGLKIQLFKNFRSRENVLDVTNLIFQNIMSKKFGDIEYLEDEYLNLGADYPKDESVTNCAGIAEMHIIELNPKDKDIDLGQDEEIDEEESEVKDLEKKQLEAKFVARKIEELINSDYMVWDKKAKKYRKVTYKDIVILLRSTSNKAPIFEKELAELSIPVFSDSSVSYLETIEIQTIMNLLKIIDNPMQDIPLVAVLRSNIGNFNDDELVQIRLADKYCPFYEALQKTKNICDEELKVKIENFTSMLEKWKNDEKYMALDEFIWQIYLDTGYYNYVSLMKNGNLRQANLKMLFDKAKKFEQSSFKGLYNFISYIDKIMIKGNSKDNGVAKLIGENDNVVRIMSIHKSKGLEFPVVFLSDTGKLFNKQDGNETLLLHQTIGFGPEYIDEELKIKSDTVARKAIRLQIEKESLAEEMRVLYVALTRAREKLFITGTQKDIKKTLDKYEKQLALYERKPDEKIEISLVKKSMSYLEWIELVYMYNKEKINDILKFETYYKEDLEKEFVEEEKEEKDIIEEIEQQEITQTNIKNQEKIKEILSWKYKNKIATILPTKTSVSRIKQIAEEKEFKDSIKEEKINEVHELKLAEILEQDKEIDEIEEQAQVLTMIPKFMKEEKKITSAQRGTLMHLCMEKIDFKKEYNLEEVKLLVEDLYKREIISQKEKEAINCNILYKYTQSDFFKELKKAKQVYKEQPFYIKVQAKEMYPDNEEDIEQLEKEKILVQGIIDLYYIDKEDKLILVDYKTDYVEKGNEQVLVKKYKKQLELYKEALEKSLNRKVDKVIIYSLHTLNSIEA